MKKSLPLVLILPLFLLVLAPHAFAQSVPPGGACKQDTDCQDANGQSYGCYPKGGGICTVDGDAPADGTVQPGGACSNDASCADVNGQSYGCYQGSCTPDGDASVCTVNTGCANYGAGWTCQVPTGKTSGTCIPPAGGAGAPTGTTANGSTGFVPLAPIPGLDDNQSSTSASSLAQFLQNLYKYLIGVAAILAVVEIIWGGLEYATQDNVSKKSDGRKRVEQALMGLALVLSPALVFTIINPSILNLSLNLPPLNTPQGTASNTLNPGVTQPGQQNGNQQISSCSDATSCQAAIKACTDKGGSAEALCIDPSGNLHEPSVVESIVQDLSLGYFGNGFACASSDQKLEVVCTGATGGVAGSQGATGGNIINGPDIYYVRFTGSDAQARASAFTCPISGAKQIPAYSLTNSASQTYWYAACYTPQITYIYNNSVSITVLQSKYSQYQQECSQLDSLPRADGASSSATFKPGLNSHPVTCDSADTVAGSSGCTQENATCTFSN